MTVVRERLWWSSPNQDPTHTQTAASNGAGDVYADNRYWPGIAAAIPARSVVGGTNFYTDFNSGHGLAYYVNGSVSDSSEWSNIGLQDIPVSWQWWLDSAGDKLTVDFDYGPDYNIAGTNRFNYQQIGAYNGGSSLVVNGSLNAENFLHLYKTAININEHSRVSITFNKPSPSDASGMSLGLIFKNTPQNIEKVVIPNSGEKSHGWTSVEFDLAEYTGKTLAAFGLVFDNRGETIANYQMNIGQIRIYDGSAAIPCAPADLTITDVFPDTGEMYIEWELDTNYARTKQYNVYVNDVYVGGGYGSYFYIKSLPTPSGTVNVVPVGADGLEGEAATVSFDLDKAVSNINTQSKENGEFAVSWTHPAGVDRDIAVELRSINLNARDRVLKQTRLPPGSTSAVFADMPVNGDDYIVRIRIGDQDSVSLSGNFIDVISQPYAGNWSWDGDRLNLPMPETRDWRYMYVYEDGVPKQFATTYGTGYRPMIVRGRSTKASLSFITAAKSVYVVMEDYAGNLSEKVYLR